MRSPNPQTIAEAIDVCRDRLRGVSPTPWLDARLLAQFITGLDASAVIAYGDAKLDTRRRSRLFELTERRAKGEPVAYLIGRKAFCGLDIAIDRRALVPRPETEELVLACVDDFRQHPHPSIADIGTGSGAVACALAHLLPRARITASDVSSDTLELAAHNIAALGFSEQVFLVRSDLLADFPECRFDALVANLPYVATAAIDDVEPDVREHEPELALVGGSDGLAVYRRLLNEAPRALAPESAVYFECGPSNAEELAHLCAAALPDAKVEIRKDASGRDRMVICRRGQSIRE